jgi:outer membrane lipoprotein carrier protein
VTRFALFFLATLSLCAAEPPADLAPLLGKIETRYNRVQSLKLSFTESYAGGRRPAQSESGVLYLRKPGRMRWEYTAPAGKLFISDGKEVFLYTPDAGPAQKSKLKESEDMHAPVAFLLGKLDFRKEFRSFEAHPEGSNANDMWITALPKSDNLAYTKVEFLATREGEIRRVRVTGQDQSKLDFSFSGEQPNVPVAQSMFAFHAPPGVEVVEAAE